MHVQAIINGYGSFVQYTWHGNVEGLAISIIRATASNSSSSSSSIQAVATMLGSTVCNW